MTNIISSPKPGHVGQVVPDKVTTVISDRFCSQCSVPHGILEPRFGPPLNAPSFLTVSSY